MTVVLAYRERDTQNGNYAWIASDSCASDAINQSVVKNAKVFHPVGRRDILIGCAGTFRLPNLLKYVPGIFPPEEELATDDIDMGYLVNEFTPIMQALTEDFEDDDAWEMLIAVGDRIYRMQMDLSIIEPADDCDSIGIGGPVALGAFKVLNELEPEMPVMARMKHALKVACASCKGCSPPFSIMRTEQIPQEILAKIPKHVPTSSYDIIRNPDEEIDPNMLAEALNQVNDSTNKKEKNQKKKDRNRKHKRKK